MPSDEFERAAGSHACLPKSQCDDGYDVTDSNACRRETWGTGTTTQGRSAMAASARTMPILDLLGAQARSPQFEGPTASSTRTSSSRE